MSEQPVSAPKGDVKLPGLGAVPKKWFLIVGGGAVVTIAYVLYKKKKGGATTAAAATDTGTAALAGQPCVDANGNPGVYDASGTCQVDTSALGGYYAGTGAMGTSGVTTPVAGTGGFTTNGQWTQQVIMDIQSLGTGVDVPTLSAALGAYIAGSPVTAAQQSLIDQAISIDGYPPVSGTGGYPPAIKLQPTGSPGGVTGDTSITGVVPNGYGGWMTVTFPDQASEAKFYASIGAASNADIPNGLTPGQLDHAVSAAGGSISGGSTDAGPAGSVFSEPNPAYPNPVPQQAASAAGGGGTYTVKSGDSLSSIASHLSYPGGWQALYAKNKSAVGSNPNLIHPGLVLTL